MDAIWTEIVKQIPSILWFLLVLIIVVLFYRPIRDELLPNLSGFETMGVSISFVKDSIDSAIELAEKSPQWKVEVPQLAKEQVLNRARRHLKIFKGTHILWIDDHPENNRNERRMFHQLKTDVDIVRNSSKALEMLKCETYDLVISDIARDAKDDLDGLQFLSEFRKYDEKTPVIFYIGVKDPDKGVPARAFGITNRPDQLLHLTLDALERKKY